MGTKKPTKRQLSHWDTILKEKGLGMSQGLNPQQESYIGSSYDLSQREEIESGNFGCGTGRRVRPKGKKPE